MRLLRWYWQPVLLVLLEKLGKQVIVIDVALHSESASTVGVSKRCKAALGPGYRQAPRSYTPTYLHKGHHRCLVTSQLVHVIQDTHERVAEVVNQCHARSMLQQGQHSVAGCEMQYHRHQRTYLVVKTEVSDLRWDRLPRKIMLTCDLRPN